MCKKPQYSKMLKQRNGQSWDYVICLRIKQRVVFVVFSIIALLAGNCNQMFVRFKFLQV